jgi:hypothetical protein
MKKIISVFLLLSHTSLLFADTLTFKSGQKIEGKLISISEEHELDPNTGSTSEVTFKVDKFSIKMVPKDLIIGKLNENTFLFDPTSVYKIIDDQGNVLLIRPFKYGSDGEFIEILATDKVVNSPSIEGAFEVADKVVSSQQFNHAMICVGLVGCVAIIIGVLTMIEELGELGGGS